MLGTRVHDSGQTHYNGRITKAGRKDIRWTMVEAAHHATRHHPLSAPVNQVILTPPDAITVASP